MSEPYIGEIRLFAGNFEPVGWAICDGRPLTIAENSALFQLIGTTYGGDGQVNFNLPDLRSRVPVHSGSSFVLGQTGGAESVTLTAQQIPTHTHPPACVSGLNTGNAASPGGNLWASQSSVGVYADQPPTDQMNAGAMQAAGGSQPHENMLPFLALNFIISLFGVFPSPT